MRRINDQLAAFFDDAAEFVTRLSAHPQFIVMTIEKRDDAFVLPPNVLDVHVATDFGRAAEGFVNVAGKKRMSFQSIAIARGDGRERNHVGGNEGSRRFD